MALLSDDEVDRGLERLHGWTREEDTIVRAVKAPGFIDAIDLVRRVADAAESANHHPDIDIRWTTVTFRLATHSEGGLTRKDLALARTIDQIVHAWLNA